MENMEEVFEIGGPIILEESLLGKRISRAETLTTIHNRRHFAEIHNEISQIDAIKDQVSQRHTDMELSRRNSDVP